MNTLLIFDGLVERLSMQNVLTGIILAILGFALVFLAKKITRICRKTTEIKDNDPIYLGCKLVALVMILIALILTIIQ